MTILKQFLRGDQGQDLIEYTVSGIVCSLVCIQLRRRTGQALTIQPFRPPHLLIDSERMEDQAAFSPDGKFIYFVNTYSGSADIYRLPFCPDKTLSMKGAGNLTHSPAAELRPSISSDGRVMAFSSDRKRQWGSSRVTDGPGFTR